MSVENLKEYARRCASEPELLEAAREFGMENMDGHMEAAERLGLDWDMRDMAAFAKELVDDDAFDEMTRQELEQIAGGFVASASAQSSSVSGAMAATAGQGTIASSTVGGSGW